MIIPEEGKPLTAAPLTPSWHAEHTPEAPAIVMGATGEAVSYAQLEDRSARLARALRARGLAEGDTECPRSVDFAGELPREPNGKLYKPRLRERYWAGHTSLIV